MGSQHLDGSGVQGDCPLTFTAASGEVLRFTPTDAAMLLENVESALDHCVKPDMSQE